MIREVQRAEDIGVAPFIYMNLGLAVAHNYLCSVCRESKAVLDMSTGILQPCWDCQKLGYELIKKKNHWWGFK